MASLTTIEMYDGNRHTHLNEMNHEEVSDSFQGALNIPGCRVLQFENDQEVWVIVRVDEVKTIRSYTLVEPLDKVRAQFRKKPATKDLNVE